MVMKNRSLMKILMTTKILLKRSRLKSLIKIKNLLIKMFNLSFSLEKTPFNVHFSNPNTGPKNDSPSTVIYHKDYVDKGDDGPAESEVNVEEKESIPVRDSVVEKSRFVLQISEQMGNLIHNLMNFKFTLTLINAHNFRENMRPDPQPVSYTHLTLPTKRIV